MRRKHTNFGIDSTRRTKTTSGRTGIGCRESLQSSVKPPESQPARLPPPVPFASSSHFFFNTPQLLLHCAEHSADTKSRSGLWSRQFGLSAARRATQPL